MKTKYSIFKVAMFLAGVFFLLFSALLSFAQNIEGTYNLYNSAGGNLEGTMTIFNQSGSRFSVSGSDWSATGQISNGSGSYSWTFSSGGSGQTIISVRSDGTIDGHVIGTYHGKELNWIYLAKPMKRTIADCEAARQICLKACEGLSSIEKLKCVNKCNSDWQKCQ